LLFNFEVNIINGEMAKRVGTSSLTAGARYRVILLLTASVFVILIGQIGRELLSPDDLREVEVAREMYMSGDYVVPHLAGLPFVEKPSGFPALVSFAYKIAGRPSELAARMTSVAFALASLMAVFLLGWRILGIEGGAIATGVLAFSTRFCITAHEVLLDNALTAAIAFTTLFAWIALDEDVPRNKHIAYAAAGFSLGMSFLFKGLVGFAIFGSGFVLYLFLSKRINELRYIFRSLPIIVFLVPILSWVVPFIHYSSPELIREFFYSNHLGRFISAYGSHHRPFYFYLINIWPQFAPGSILLPLAVWMAWKTRKEKDNQAGIFFLAFFVGPVIFLSASSAKESVYFLPVYPALAILVSWCIMKRFFLSGRSASIFAWGIATLVILSVTILVGITWLLEGTNISIASATVIFSLAAIGCMYSISHDDFQWTGTFIAILFAIGWSLWFTGPLAAADIAKNSIRKPLMEALNRAGSRDIVLYDPNDGIRGATGFYRNRTAQEIRSPDMLVARLGEKPDNTVALIYMYDQAKIIEYAKGIGKNLRIEATFAIGKKHLFLISAGPK
jgi:4-amino-4-deoxy-L-arabinose transferase-like glycosyltransferase